MAKKSKDSLTYFLDHPQIKRAESVGNGNTPGSLAAAINFGGKGTAAPASPKPSTPAPSQPTTSSKPSIASQINFGGRFKK